ncbi:hypothetical protein C2S53_019880 [Perilla frutescens var. hirtella]|uniref:Uncharacterized protein n=1 Tax=Perilla frutescens var. hirtella TaxID=608512 RepID=A0AAD4J6P8_PERFH|nr:hypothetical protein C2S53_019880 [Perilla frutescens var. hirtella]
MFEARSDKHAAVMLVIKVSQRAKWITRTHTRALREDGRKLEEFLMMLNWGKRKEKIAIKKVNLVAALYIYWGTFLEAPYRSFEVIEFVMVGKGAGVEVLDNTSSLYTFIIHVRKYYSISEEIQI